MVSNEDDSHCLYCRDSLFGLGKHKHFVCLVCETVRCTFCSDITVLLMLLCNMHFCDGLQDDRLKRYPMDINFICLCFPSKLSNKGNVCSIKSATSELVKAEREHVL